MPKQPHHRRPGRQLPQRLRSLRRIKRNLMLEDGTKTHSAILASSKLGAPGAGCVENGTKYLAQPLSHG